VAHRRGRDRIGVLCDERPGEDLALERRRGLLRRGRGRDPLAQRQRCVAPQLVGSDGEVDGSVAGIPSTDGAAPGRKRTPTTVVPGARTSMVGPVCGPTSRGSEPIWQYSSTPPLGTVRCA
jgi:hypothetical protein